MIASKPNLRVFKRFFFRIFGKKDLLQDSPPPSQKKKKKEGGKEKEKRRGEKNQLA